MMATTGATVQYAEVSKLFPFVQNRPGFESVVPHQCFDKSLPFWQLCLKNHKALFVTAAIIKGSAEIREDYLKRGTKL